MKTTFFFRVPLQGDMHAIAERRRARNTFGKRLLKSIYAQKHASRQWYKLFHVALSSLAFNRATSDTNLYTINHHVHGISIVLLSVDDTLIVSDSVKIIESTKRAIKKQFRMTDFGEAKQVNR
jgi:hypothetical protein